MKEQELKELENIRVHMEVLCTPEIREHACASTEHDLHTQIFRLLVGYNELLGEQKRLKTPTALGLEKIWHEAESANFGPPWIGSKVRQVICEAIHASLPVHPDDGKINDHLGILDRSQIIPLFDSLKERIAELEGPND